MRTIINDVFDYSSTLAFHNKYKPPATGPLCKQVVSPLCCHPGPPQSVLQWPGWVEILTPVNYLALSSPPPRRGQPGGWGIPRNYHKN